MNSFNFEPFRLSGRERKFNRHQGCSHRRCQGRKPRATK